MNWSCADTVMLKATPATAPAGATTLRCVAAVALTGIAADVPIIELLTVSVAVRVWLPEVLRVTWNVPVPFVRVAFAGSVAAVSLLVNVTVPL